MGRRVKIRRISVAGSGPGKTLQRLLYSLTHVYKEGGAGLFLLTIGGSGFLIILLFRNVADTFSLILLIVSLVLVISGTLLLLRR